jgi:hypothetical protein
MITLTQAFRICHIGNEFVYLKTKESIRSVGVSARRLRELVDMKKIEVVGIDVRFETCGPDFLGMEFKVKGISQAEIERLSFM